LMNLSPSCLLIYLTSDQQMDPKCSSVRDPFWPLCSSSVHFTLNNRIRLLVSTKIIYLELTAVTAIRDKSHPTNPFPGSGTIDPWVDRLHFWSDPFRYLISWSVRLIRSSLRPITLTGAEETKKMIKIYPPTPLNPPSIGSVTSRADRGHRFIFKV
jgi:hypothetical protein